MAKHVTSTFGLRRTTLYPFACFGCRKAFKRVFDETEPDTKPCPECGGAAIRLSRKFKPPAMKDAAQWKKVQYLVENGYRFETVYDETGAAVRYPKTLQEAHEFVARHKARRAAAAKKRKQST